MTMKSYMCVSYGTKGELISGSQARQGQLINLIFSKFQKIVGFQENLSLINWLWKGR